MKITKLIGKRCLLKIGLYGKEVEEFRVIEISPSGNWVKLQNIYGNKYWKPVSECALFEELIELRPERPPAT